MAEQRTSLATVADFAGVSVAHLYDVVKCKKAATCDFLAKVAPALKVEPWQLLVPPDEPAGDAPVKAPAKPKRRAKK